ncbi:PTS system lactose transporter subunit/cellobiose transporter subunit IIC [Leuconostoc gasicomitatum]|uniref:PTS cellobiose transporter subunit IIC n=1 Tax=Leuconostoc gelidum group TaxID=3016637 RepID=UPI00027E6976|nr:MULTISPECIES: PTS cellobiose transporter subunit IIC [Leuconostoc gelidum group]AFS40089.1 PTS system lactose transporter subunit/cellobiose transporter subunit IIC [Leuconostoc gelidum JB7]MBZ5952104.1 PTS sugar transporter subunit IIC [Leuconostoc gasicomitatum]MBZ5968271.1 PTS sugar transporter subunit IIC [Leuconostoc gasicomitatum]MBZ5986748.1 PTS sugar transporter subunit IIC [Leuconostoc gelidum subsp. gelidum]QDJ30153.1 PTS cellobiose transporter subunit IIC [Leuconostoc gelidum sub
MLNRFINTVQNLDMVLCHRPFLQAISVAMQQSVPILAIDIYCRLFFKLVISPDALFATIFNQHLITADIISNRLMFIIQNLDIAVTMIFVIGLTYHYLTQKGIKNTTLPIVTNFIAIYMLLFAKNQSLTNTAIHYLLLTFFTLFSCYTYYWYYHRFKITASPFSLKYLLWSIIIISTSLLLHVGLHLSSITTIISSLLSKSFFTTFSGLLLISILSPLLFIIGFSLPSELSSNQMSLNAVISNLDKLLTHGLTNLPFPENLYSIYGAFTLFGGVGNTLTLNVLLLFAVSKKYKRLGLLSWLPSLFDNNYLLYAGLPMFLRPLILVPMLLVNITSMLISYVAIAGHIVQPAVFITPNNLPNILLPTLASATPIRSTILAVLIFSVSLLIYRPFLDRLMPEVTHEK